MYSVITHTVYGYTSAEDTKEESMRKIEVVKYDSSWPKLFEKEKQLIQEILKDECLAIYHIGSTSVPLLAAKPIIDIMPVVKDIKNVDDYQKQFEMIGYEYLGENGIPGRRFLTKGGDDRTHHIHIFQMDDYENIDRHLAVSEYLKSHRKVANEYAKLKKKLAQQYTYDNLGYCNGKDEFVKKLEKEALIWYGKYR